MNWLHKLFNPHCSHCIDEAREMRICNSCEILKHEIEVLRAQNKELLDSILYPNVPELPKQLDDLKPVLPHRVSWSVRKQMLENEDREKAKLLKQHPNNITDTSTITELEKELGVS